ncbi:polyhomeotic-like protein 3 isoform X2 [Anolis carolinensis]|uniref:polyhomeotic-like protein 3 isoform X2 n=1 Tax=Anolis carolinensis TaxID=28377 RepID=UPI0001F9C90E|nr:PREDICTED: polyhomeotic-like protein 3 isoform X2 [Anolis carolinensis]|eukprot:XP_003218202.1 PREDICTED: polyhomeotic-like protein 3 isoform X2 [Anolis carolinensis]
MENEPSTTTSSTGTTTIATTSSPSRTQPPQISVYSGSDRHAVQVIQQALHRPPSSAAQYLQQMYAAQQQHLMLQTAALQQQHLSSTQFQSLASVPQANLSGGRQCASPNGNVTQQSSMSETSINLSASPTPAQLISRSQASNTSSSSLTQQTMLLGSTSPTLTASQAQMYLRAQMLIFTPATTVAAVQSDIPVVSSSSSFPCQSAATQVQNLTLRSQKLGVLSSSQNGSPKTSSQAQALGVCPNKPITSTKASQSDPPESKRKGDSPTAEPRSPAVTRTSNIHQLIAPASYSPIQPHSLLKHQQSSLHSPPSKMSHHQLIFQQQQVQPISLQLPPGQETSASQQHCVPPVQSHALPPAPSSASSQHGPPAHIHPPLPPPPSPTPSQSSQQSVVVSPAPPPSPSQSPNIIIHPQALIQSQSHHLASSGLHSQHSPAQADGSPTEPMSHSANLPPQLPSSPVVHVGSAEPPSIMSAGQQISSPTSHPQYPALQSTPIPVATSPQLSTSPMHTQPLPLPPVPSLQVQPEILSQGQVLVQNTLVSEEELPAAEALVQLPFQTLPPPQTVAVNLQVQQAVPVETPVIYQVEGMCEEDIPEESDCGRMARTPTPPTLSPPAITREDLNYEESFSEQEGHPSMALSVSASVIKSSSDPSHASIAQPPLLLPAITTRSNCAPASHRNPSVESKLPQAIVKPQILTHVIEGFVIQEGLEPFPVSCSSLMIDQPAKKRALVEGQVMNVMCVDPELQNNAKHADNSSDTELEDIADEGLDEMETDLLKCEFCGKMGYANKFLRSKRFCTMSCAKRYNVSCSKKFGLYSADKSSRWNRSSESQSLGRRGRRPGSCDGAPREPFHRQLPITYPSAEEDLASQEDSVPVAMTTRLRRQSERERERELRELRIRKTSGSMDLLPTVQSDPSIWSVEDVWAFIRSLPGCQDIADEFRAQEIDGQALLLLKEDHLMSAMNIKLGPALKICARINSLKES